MVRCPADPETEGLNGQTVLVQLPSVTGTVRELKELLAPQVGGMAANRQQLRDASRGFLKDSQSLASYNLAGDVHLELVPRSRGGRR
ncbi:unnamed protein product [Phaeothamnion confervicola]